MKLVPIYDPVNAQAGPQFGLEARGHMQRSTYEGSTTRRVVRQDEAWFERTFALL